MNSTMARLGSLINGLESKVAQRKGGEGGYPLGLCSAKF